jgi:hypothetical protein
MKRTISLISIILFLLNAKSVYSQNLKTILGKWKLIAIRESYRPEISHAKNKVINGQLTVSFVNESKPRTIMVNTENFIGFSKKGAVGNNKITIVGFSGCNNFNCIGELTSNLIEIGSFNQIDYFICDSTEFESEYFKTLNNEYQSTRFIYKFEGNKLLLYLDYNDSNFASFRSFKLSVTSQKFLDNFFSEPIAVFIRVD